MMTMTELAVLGLGLLAVLVIYGFVFYDMYKCFENEEVKRVTEEQLAEAESTLGLVEDDEE